MYKRQVYAYTDSAASPVTKVITAYVSPGTYKVVIDNKRSCLLYTSHSAPYGLKLGYTPEMLTVTEDLAKRILRLPLYVDMTSEDAMYVVDSIKEVLKG